MKHRAAPVVILLTIAQAGLGDFTYHANEINQYRNGVNQQPVGIVSNNSRTVVGIAPVGENVTVTVNTETADRIGRVFHAALAETGPQWLEDIDVTCTEASIPATTHRDLWFPAAATNPTYDDDGNLANDGQWSYVWDGNNRLVEMETTSAAVTAGRPYRKLTFAYDWTGHRLQRKVEGPNSEVISDTRWLWDDWNQIAEYTKGGTGGSPVLSQTYTWGLDLSGTLQGAGGVGGLLCCSQITDNEITEIVSLICACLVLLLIMIALVRDRNELLYLLQIALGMIWVLSFVLLLVPLVSLGTSI